MSLSGLRMIIDNPHHLELGVLGGLGFVALIWIEARKPEPWIEWLVWSVLLPPFLLFLFDMDGNGLDTSPISLGIALAVGVGGGGLVTLRSIGRRRRLDGLREAAAPARREPLNIGNG